MEEILASIKRVIAEDSRVAGTTRSGRKPAVRAEAPPPAPEDVLELDDPMPEPNGLVSDNAAAASRQALAALAAVREGPGEAPLAAGDHGPLEAVVRDMLRPMLKDWLDQHLPELVEELVRREIARITGKSL